MPKEQSGLEEETNRPETEKSSGVNKVITRRGFLKTLASTVGALSAQRLFPGLGITHPSSVSAQEQSSAVSSGVPIEDGVFYSEDGVNGYKVEGPMFEIFQSIGGESTWGKAISRSWIDELGRINQAFEKGILQLSADGKGGFSVEFANIFDILHDLGKDEWLKNYRQVPPAQSWSSDKGKTWPETIQAHLTITDSYPALRAFIEANPDWINQYGLPVAIEDYGPWVSLRMQRANLQLLKTDLPYGKAGDVLVANGGTVAKEAGGIIPPQALKQQTLAETTSTIEVKKEPKTLKEAAQKIDFYIGTGVGGFGYPEYYNQMVTVQSREFNLGLMFVMWHSMEKQRGSVDYAPVQNDLYIASRNSMKTLGHALVWGSKVPEWLKRGNFTRDETIQLMQDRIRDIMTRFRFKEYVVVNEAYGSNDFLNQKIGPDYVDIAFKTARETDPSAKLIYNDYDNHSQNSTTFGPSRYRNTKGVVDRLASNGLIDKVGLEMILFYPKIPSVDDVTQTMQSYGIPVVVTEFGVNIKDLEGTQEQRYQKQAKIYADMLTAAINSGVCKDFVVFLAGDKISPWETELSLPGASSENDPTPFDDNFQPKPAYFAMLDVLKNVQGYTGGK